MKITEFAPDVKDKVILVDFNAPWCGPCRQMAPIIKTLVKKYNDRVGIVEINIDSQPAVAIHYMVQSIPTLILFVQGVEIKRFVGIQPPETLEKNIDIVLTKKS